MTDLVMIIDGWRGGDFEKVELTVCICVHMLVCIYVGVWELYKFLRRDRKRRVVFGDDEGNLGSLVNFFVNLTFN